MAPPAQPSKPNPDAESKERNQYIPNFIADKPFYVPADDSKDYLEHQRLQKVQDSTIANTKWYDRGAKLGPAVTKFRKGACENCGSMSHKTKECLSRPRKQGAKWTGKDLQADDVVMSVKLGWDAKRDRWNGYDPQEYQNVVDEFNELEMLKRAKAGELAEGDGKEGAKYDEETDMGRQQSNSTRALRLREDTAGYLKNLDLDSTKYDPKTRTMVDDGTQIGDGADAEDGFVKKASGDAADFEKAQKYAWESQERGGSSAQKLHLQANPTAGELLIKKEVKAATNKKETQKKALFEKYGGTEYLKEVPDDVKLITASEKFVEYDESGGIKGAPKINPKSKYIEDVFPNNHTTVWGSWWHDFNWGFACCYSLVKNSYCTGEAGKEAFADEQRRKAGLDLDLEDVDYQDPTRLAIEDAPANDQEANSKRERKRKIADTGDGVTEKDMEEYRRKRLNAIDPMSKMLGNDKLVH
jgi:pre-mRNA-processing factor SLU7